MNKQKRPARKLLSSLIMAGLSLPLGAALAASTVAGGFGDLSLATLVPNTRVVVDPELETPALVSFEAVGGLPVGGADEEAIGRAAFFHPMVSKMYGSLNPNDHLKFLSAYKDHRGEQRIAFEQREKGVRVEGAYVTVTVTPKSRVREIHGRFLYYPQVDWNSVLNSQDIEEQALAAYLKSACGKEGDCWLPGDRDGQRQSVSAELVVLSSRVMQGTSLPPQTERLAWRYVYPLADVYVDASGKDGVLLTLDKLNDTIPRDVYDRPTLSLQVTTDPAKTAAQFPIGEALSADIIVGHVDSFYASHGRDGYDGAGGQIEAWVNWERENAAFWANDGSVTEHPWLKGMPAPVAGIFFGEKFLGNDVVAHELTHGVTTFSAGLAYSGESGALNESYSDVIANLVFPDNVPNQWLVGEDTKHGAIRDMVNPSQSPFPNVHWQPDHVMSLPYACLSGGDHCVHTWSGVPNLAAVLIAQGGFVPASGITVGQGIGREKLAVLYMQTLTGMRLGPGSNFLSQRLATISECQDLVASGYTAAGSKPFTAQDCAIVAEAFDAVGVEAKPQYGWMRFQNGLGTAGADVSFFVGDRYFNGCTIADQRLALRSDQGPVQASTLRTLLNVGMGGWGAWVSWRGAATDPADRAATVHLWADWTVPNPTVSFTDTPAVPAGLTAEQCLTPLQPPGSPPVHLRSIYSTQRVSHWASFFNGGRYDETVNAGVQLPAGCSVINVRGIAMNRTGPVGSAVPSMDFGDHGFRVSAGQPGDPSALDAFVHSWHDGLTAVALRVAYDVVEPEGTDCLVPGALQDTP
jgi:Zn-dependent metalloprotease